MTQLVMKSYTEPRNWGCCENGNELLDSIKYGEFLD